MPQDASRAPQGPLGAAEDSTQDRQAPAAPGEAAEGAGAAPAELRTLLRVARPTWELELLISGAVIFSLFQLPGVLGDLYFRVEHHLSADLVLVPTLLFYGAMLCVLVLMVGFAVHFLARGFWVALCGLNAAFPEGILWDRLDVGPVQREYYERSTPPAKALEERADRFASTIFPLLFYMLFSVAVTSAYMVGGVVVIGGLVRWAFPGVPEVALLYGVLLLFLGPGLVVAIFDARYKKRPERLERAPGLRRRLLRVFAAWQRFAVLQPLYGAIPLTFQSHFSTKKATWAFMGGSFAFAGAFALIFLIRLGVFGYDSYVFLPAGAEELVVAADHYETLRAPESRARVPTIDGDVVTGPYVRLFVPYRPTSDRKLVERACPGLEPLREEGLFVRPLFERRIEALGEDRLQEILDCFGRIWHVRLDGRAVRPDWSFHRHPRRGTAGLVAHLPVAGLEPGRHELVVAKGAVPGAPEGSREAPEGSREPPDEAAAGDAPAGTEAGAPPEGAGESDSREGAETTDAPEASDDRLERRYVIPFWT